MARTSRGLLFAVLAAGLLAAAHAQASAGKGSGATKAVVDGVNSKLAKLAPAHAALANHTDAFHKSVAAQAKSLEAMAANTTSPMLKRIYAGKGAIHAATERVVDAVAASVNGAALKANKTITPLNKAATDFMAPLKRTTDKLFHAHSKTVEGAVQDVANDVEWSIKPSTDSIGRVMHPIRDEINKQFGAGFNATRDMVTRSQTAMNQAMAPLSPATDALAAVQSAVVEATLKKMIKLLDSNAAAIDKVSTKFDPLEKTIHGVVDPIDKNAKYVRTKINEYGTNVTKPVKELTYKLVPETRPPRLGQLFASIFDNLPPPAERDWVKDPPRKTDPVLPKVGPPGGTCKPFVVPKPYKSLMHFCDAMKDMPQEYFGKMFNKSAPAKGTPFPFDGCVFGCIVGNDSFTQLQREFSEGFGWSGKCFTKERVNGVPTRFGSTLNRNFQKLTGYSQKDRVNTFKGVGEFVFGGDGSWIEKGLYDGRPSFQYVDDRPTAEMMAAGGWRSLYNLFQAVGDGVSDEFRPLAPGIMIGKSFYSGPQGLMPQKWRTPRDTNFFMLFQSCTSDGRIPHDPEDRDVPLVGLP